MKFHKSDLGHLMMTAPKDQILKRLDPGIQTKPDHMWHGSRQFLPDLPGLKVTTPVIVPGREREGQRERDAALKPTKTSCSTAACYRLEKS